MTKNEVVDITLQVLEDHGIKGTVEPRGKHCAVNYTLPDGREQHIICAVSPSDSRRAMLNARGFVRRKMREFNIPLLPPKPVTSLAHALSIPKPVEPPSNRLAMLEMDFTALLDLVTDVQQENITLAQRVQELQEKLSRPLVLSATFAEQAPVAAPQPVPEPLNVPPVPKPQAAYVPVTRQKRGREAVLAGMPPGKWMHVSEIRIVGGYTHDEKDVNASSMMLSNLKKQGFVESGQRGYWRRPVVVGEAKNA